MPYSIDDATAQALVALEPWTASRSREPVQEALALLVEAEQARRGMPDGKTGALNPLALTQGTLLKDEYDLSTHAHHAGWRVGAAIVDVRSMISFNAAHGFPAGDLLLKATAEGLKKRFPGAQVLRLQGDAFAALLTPSSQLTLTDEDRERTIRALGHEARRATPAAAEPPGYTVALLELTIEAPSHWQVLGPLVWAELERAYLLARRGQAQGVQRRRLALDGFVPPMPEP